MTRHPFIVGERLYLRGLTREDLSGNMFGWANDADEIQHMLYNSNDYGRGGFGLAVRE
jgi:hypothetical protein